jgi:hypothetical protein
MRVLVAVWMAVGAIGCGDDSPGTVLPVECGGTEVAPGYPTVGGECRAHVIFDDNGGEMASTKGARAFGDLLSGIHVESGSDGMSIVLENLDPGSGGDCTTLTFNELSSGINGHLNVTMQGDANAVWGTFEAKACIVIDTEVIDGEITYIYRCSDLVGKFAALRDPAETCAASCDPPMQGPAECVVPYCSGSGGESCGSAVCNTGAQVCIALSPVPSGTYRGDIPYPTTITFASGAISAIRIDEMYEETSPTDFNVIPVVYEVVNPPASALMRDGGRFFIEANLTRTPSWPGTGRFHLMIVPSIDGAMLESNGTFRPASFSEFDYIELEGTLVRQ